MGRRTPLPPTSSGRRCDAPSEQSRGQPHQRSRGPRRGLCWLSREAVRPPILARPLPAPGPPGPVSSEPRPAERRPGDQRYSPVRSRPPGSHLMTPPTPRFLIGSGISANGLGPFWPRGRHGNRPRLAPFRNLFAAMDSSLSTSFLLPFPPFLLNVFKGFVFFFFLPHSLLLTGVRGEESIGLDFERSSFPKEGGAL